MTDVSITMSPLVLFIISMLRMANRVVHKGSHDGGNMAFSRAPTLLKEIKTCLISRGPICRTFISAPSLYLPSSPCNKHLQRKINSQGIERIWCWLFKAMHGAGHHINITDDSMKLPSVYLRSWFAMLWWLPRRKPLLSSRCFSYLTWPHHVYNI